MWDDHFREGWRDDGGVTLNRAPLYLADAVYVNAENCMDGSAQRMQSSCRRQRLNSRPYLSFDRATELERWRAA